MCAWTWKVAVSMMRRSFEERLDTKSWSPARIIWIGSSPTGMRASSRRVPVSTTPMASSPRKAVKASGAPVSSTTVKSSQASAWGKYETLPLALWASI